MRTLFTSIANHYDLINRVLSLGQDQRWRKSAIACAQIPAQGKVLDIATGTGDLAVLIQKQHPAGLVIGADLTPAMLQIAQKKAPELAIPWMVSDGLALPFADNCFDAVASAFMMRNVPDVVQAYQEQRRVVKTGSRVVCLEFTWPQHFPLTWLLSIYFFGFAPILGQLISGDRQAYEYLPRSIKSFLRPEEMLEKMRAAGLRECTYMRKMLGTVIIYKGIK